MILMSWGKVFLVIKDPFALLSAFESLRYKPNLSPSAIALTNTIPVTPSISLITCCTLIFILVRIRGILLSVPLFCSCKNFALMQVVLQFAKQFGCQQVQFPSFPFFSGAANEPFEKTGNIINANRTLLTCSLR